MMLRRTYITLLILLLAACGSAEAPLADAPPLAATIESPATPQLVDAQPSPEPTQSIVDAQPTPTLHFDTLDLSQPIEWEGWLVQLPPSYAYESLTPENTYDSGGTPILSTLSLMPTSESQPRVELPATMAFRIVQFDGTPQEFLEVVRQTPSEQPWLEEASVRETTVAGRPAIVYERYGEPLYRNYIVTAKPGTLLLIDTDLHGSEQQSMIDTLISTY